MKKRIRNCIIVGVVVTLVGIEMGAVLISRSIEKSRELSKIKENTSLMYTYNYDDDVYTNNSRPYKIRAKKLAKRMYDAMLIIDEEGYLWTGGYSNIQNHPSNYSPIRVSDTLKFQAVEDSTYGGIVLDINGNLWENDTGLETTTQETIGYGSYLKKVNDKKYKSIAGGWETFFAIDENNILWGWGSNDYGQLGTGTKEETITRTMEVIKSDIAQVSTGRDGTLAIDLEGNLWAWGAIPKDLSAPINSLVPKKILTSYKFTNISVGEGSYFAVDTLGNLWGWGINRGGQLGQGDNDLQLILEPTILKTNIKDVSASDYTNNTILLDKEGYVWVAGRNGYGQLGVGNRDSVTTFTKTIGNIKSIACGKEVAFYMDNNNDIYGAGHLNYVASGESRYVTTPIQMTTYPNSYPIEYQLNRREYTKWKYRKLCTWE